MLWEGCRKPRGCYTQEDILRKSITTSEPWQVYVLGNQVQEPRMKEIFAVSILEEPIYHQSGVDRNDSKLLGGDVFGRIKPSFHPAPWPCKEPTSGLQLTLWEN